VPSLEEHAHDRPASTVRQRLEQHRTRPACAGCHKIMDPVGLALENFDAVGAWRVRDSGFPVDPRGQLMDGTPVAGPTSLRRALAGHSDAFLRAFTVKLMTYALGRRLGAADMPAVRAVLREAAGANYRTREARRASDSEPMHQSAGGGSSFRTREARRASDSEPMHQSAGGGSSFRFGSLALAIVKSRPFRMRTAD
jgi:hypothetical protein